MKRSEITSYKGLSFLFLLALGLVSCGGGSSEDPKPDPVPDPVAAVLEFPANNEVCTDGNVISATLSEVTFSWQPAEHTDRYELEVTNLNTETTNTYPSTTTELSVSLERGVPYSWNITSQASNTQAEASSDTWKFYLAGEGVTSYAPFPADLTGPASGSTTDPSTVTFTWKGSDADSETLAYELFVDTIDGRTEMQASSLTEGRYEMENLQAGTVYYWSVRTIDPEGNSSISPSVIFKTQ